MSAGSPDWLQAGLVGTLLASFGAVLKFTFDVVTGKRVRRVVDGEAELRLAEMVKRVAADEVETLTKRLDTAERRGRRAHDELAGLHEKVETLEQGREDAARDSATKATEIAGLQRRVVGVIDDRDDLVRFITTLREWVAAGAIPPYPSVPESLADVLPEWIPGDGAEPPKRVRPRRVRPDGTD